MKTIVTHIGPDLDAITSIWLIKTFFSGWQEAGFAFVPAGTTLDNSPPDDNPEILHVDTGFGKFDHHQSNEDTCAAKKIYEYIKENSGENRALDRLVHVVNDVDHFREVYYPNASSDIWDFSLDTLIDGWKALNPNDPLQVVARSMDALDAVYRSLQVKISAEKDLSEHAIPFDVPWGKAIGIESGNEEVVRIAQKNGTVLVVRKDPKGFVRIKALPREDIDLTPIYTALTKQEPEATWFLHASKLMLLNGSSKNPNSIPSKLPLDRVMQIVKDCVVHQ